MATTCFVDSQVTRVYPPPEGAALAHKKGYAGDAFYVSEDGHFVGDDGFKVPMDFGEFFGRFPNYVWNWVKKHCHGKASAEDIEDWSQALFAHLSALPAESKYRVAGKSDVIQTFDPFLQHGASERRFRNYVNFRLANKLNTIRLKEAQSPVVPRQHIPFDRPL